MVAVSKTDFVCVTVCVIHSSWVETSQFSLVVVTVTVSAGGQVDVVCCHVIDHSCWVGDGDWVAGDAHAELIAATWPVKYKSDRMFFMLNMN